MRPNDITLETEWVTHSPDITNGWLTFNEGDAHDASVVAVRVSDVRRIETHNKRVDVFLTSAYETENINDEDRGIYYWRGSYVAVRFMFDTAEEAISFFQALKLAGG